MTKSKPRVIAVVGPTASGKSYCDGYAKTFATEDCGIDYKIYIKCNEYKTKGYKDYK